MSKNLVDIIIDALKKEGKTERDILYVNNHDSNETVTWEDFKKHIKLFKRVDETESFSEINIIGEDWWLEEENIDNYFRFWSFKTKPKPFKATTISKSKSFKDCFYPFYLNQENSL